MAYKDTWKMILDLMNESGKRFIFSGQKSSYENWMRNQMEWQRKKEQENDKSINGKNVSNSQE